MEFPENAKSLHIAIARAGKSSGAGCDSQACREMSGV
jgi:hypothetical protein